MENNTAMKINGFNRDGNEVWRDDSISGLTGKMEVGPSGSVTALLVVGQHNGWVRGIPRGGRIEVTARA
jgi:hypothetical protein